MSHPKNVVELLQQLVAIPSVNPDGDPGTEQTGEEECAQFVGEFLKECGAEVSFDEVLPGRPNVIGRFPSEEEGKPCVLLGPHTDTVGISGMTIEPFGGELRDGRIWGRGASDTKGSMASMLWALYELKDEIPKLNVRPMFAGFMSEESSQFGSRDFAGRYADEVDFAIAGEPTMLNVVYKHKACWWLEIATKGVAAHGSLPSLGENAVIKMTNLLQEVNTEFTRKAADFEDDVMGAPTLSVNMIEGGNRPNVVPDSCSAVLDIRATPKLHQAGIVELIQSLLDAAGEPDAEISIRGQSPTLDTDPQNPFVRKLAALGSSLVDAPWFCDGGWLAQGGIPSVALGPGSIDQAHTKDEWIRVEDLEAGAGYFKRFLESC